MTSSITRIGWIGTGVMGSSMVNHILSKAPKGQYVVNVFNRSANKCASTVLLGASQLASPKAIAQSSDIVFTMVGFPSDVKDIYYGEDGILQNLREGGIAVDFTTSEPSLATQIAADAKLRGVSVLDAPVSGGDIGAKNGTLSIMCGGEEDTFNKVKPIMEFFGKTMTLCGTAGMGQHTKMVNQLLICSNMIGVCEALLYAHKCGLDPEKALQAVSSGAAGSWSLSNLGPRMLNRNFDPGFFVEHFVKDLSICLAEARKMKLSLPGLSLAYSLYMSLMALGHERLGTQSLLLALENLNGIKGEIKGKAGELIEEKKKEQESKEKESK